MFISRTLFGCLLSAAATNVLVGCSSQAPPTAKVTTPSKIDDHKAGEHKAGEHEAKEGDHKDGGHEHKPGSHGGMLVSLGKDSYHAEVVFAKGGVVQMYVLGKDESKTQEIEVQELIGQMTAAGTTDAVPVKFAAEPQKGDSSGKTTLFVAKLPTELQEKKLKVVINNIQIGSERFRIEFSNEKGDHH